MCSNLYCLHWFAVTNTDMIAIACEASHECIRKALIWLKAHNILYHDIKIDENTLTTFPENDVLPVHIEIINREDSGEDLSSWYDQPQSPTSSQNHGTSSVNDTIFDSIVVTGLNNDATVNQMHAAA